MRPENSNSTSCAGSRNPGVAQPASSSSAAPARKRRTGLRIETLQCFLKGLVSRAGLLRLLPDAARLVALAEHPPNFAQVRADFAVGAAAPGAPQLLGRALQVAHAVLHPAHRVDNEEVVGRERERLL